MVFCAMIRIVSALLIIPVQYASIEPYTVDKYCKVADAYLGCCLSLRLTASGLRSSALPTSTVSFAGVFLGAKVSTLNAKAITKRKH
jgi:hypothetical protein